MMNMNALNNSNTFNCVFIGTMQESLLLLVADKTHPVTSLRALRSWAHGCGGHYGHLLASRH